MSIKRPNNACFRIWDEDAIINGVIHGNRAIIFMRPDKIPLSVMNCGHLCNNGHYNQLCCRCDKAIEECPVCEEK